MTLTATGSRTEVGESENTYDIDWGGTDAGNYTVTEQLGTLTVLPNSAEVTLTAAGGEKVYDGTALSDPTVTAAGLPEGFTAEATASGSQLNAGESANTVDAGWIIRNADGEDRTDSFTNVTTVDGTLTVTARSLTLTSADDTKAYDGEPLTNSEVTVTGDGFAEGEGAAYDVTGSQTLVGSGENTFTYTLNEGTLAENYEITVVYGTLTVTGEPIEPEKTTEPVETPYAIGDTIPFEIRVHNVSDEVVAQVTVMDETAEIAAGEGYTVLDAHTALITNLQPDATVVVTALHEVTNEDILAGEYENTATVRMPDGREYEAVGSTDRFEPVNASLTVTDIVTNPHEDGSNFGLDEVIEYEVNVTNDGNVDLYNVTVVDETTGLNEVIDVLHPGETVTFTPTHTVTVEDIEAGEVVSTVNAEADEVTDPEGGTQKPTAEASVTTPVSQNYTITVNYLIEGGDLIYTITETHEYGYAYSFTSPEVEGYETDTLVVEGVLTEDTVVDVIYRARLFTLTIHYRYEDGAVAARTYTAEVAYGTQYNVASPVIAGYTASILRVTGTMPARDVTVTVIYTADIQVIVLEGTGVGPAGLNVGESIE